MIVRARTFVDFIFFVSVAAGASALALGTIFTVGAAGAEGVAGAWANDAPDIKMLAIMTVDAKTGWSVIILFPSKKVRLSEDDLLVVLY